MAMIAISLSGAAVFLTQKARAATMTAGMRVARPNLAAIQMPASTVLAKVKVATAVGRNCVHCMMVSMVLLLSDQLAELPLKGFVLRSISTVKQAMLMCRTETAAMAAKP